MEFYEETISTETLYTGKILNLRKDRVKLPNGKTAAREIIEHKNGVGILPVKKDTMLFVKQFRPAIGAAIVEVPAGLMEDGETPEDSAVRELREEIGLNPKKLAYAGEIWPTPGCCDEKTYLFIAEDLEENALSPDDDEFIQIVEIPIPTVRVLYQKGRFTDAKTMSLLGYYFSQFHI